jgi:putative addiction module antidote
MRVRETVIRPIGNSAGVTIPKETLEKYDLSPGDKIFLQETEYGILVTPHDPAFAEAMAVARRIGKRYRNALRELSKR